MKIYIGIEILNLGTRWRTMVSFTPRRLYHRGKSPRNALYRRNVGRNTADPGAVKNRKISFTFLESNSDTLIIRPIVYTLY
jgi:hypothetical protein